MPYITTSGGLNFQYPTDGTTNWGQTLATTWAAISSHDHSGGNKGTPISAASLAANTINDVAIRLRSGQYLRSLNNAGSGDINVIRSNASDLIEFGAALATLSAATITTLTSNTLQRSGGAITIGPTDANNIQFQSNGGGVFLFDQSTNTVRPNVSAAIGLGTSSFRWGTIYSNTIQSVGGGMTVGSTDAQSLFFQTNATQRWNVNTSGDLSGDATNGGNLIFNKAGTGVTCTVATGLNSAGSTIADATVLTKTINVCATFASAIEGVKLWDAPVGQEIIVVCSSPLGFKIYPATGAQFINNLGAGTAYVLGSTTTATIRKVAAAQWWVTSAS